MMQTEIATNGAGKKREKALGRKDKSKQETVIELDVVRDGVDNLVGLYRQAGEAAATYGDAIKAVAEKSGLLAATIRKFVQARASEDFAEQSRRVKQLALVFEECGE